MPKIRSLWISSQNFDPMLFKVLKVFTRCCIHYSVLLGLLVSNIHILGHNRKQKAWGRSPAQAIVWGHYLLVVHVPWQFYCSFAVSIWKWFNVSKYLLASFMMALYLTCQSVCSSCFGQKKKIPVFHQWMYRWHSVQAQVCAVCIWKCSLVVLGCTLKAKEFVESWLEEKKKGLAKCGLGAIATYVLSQCIPGRLSISLIYISGEIQAAFKHAAGLLTQMIITLHFTSSRGALLYQALHQCEVKVVPCPKQEMILSPQLTQRFAEQALWVFLTLLHSDSDPKATFKQELACRAHASGTRRVGSGQSGCRAVPVPLGFQWARRACLSVVLNQGPLYRKCICH